MSIFTCVSTHCHAFIWSECNTLEIELILIKRHKYNLSYGNFISNFLRVVYIFCRKEKFGVIFSIFFNDKNLAYNVRVDTGLISGETVEASQVGSEKLRRVITTYKEKGEK